MVTLSFSSKRYATVHEFLDEVGKLLRRETGLEIRPSMPVYHKDKSGKKEEFGYLFPRLPEGISWRGNPDGEQWAIVKGTDGITYNLHHRDQIVYATKTDNGDFRIEVDPKKTLHRDGFLHFRGQALTDMVLSAIEEVIEPTTKQKLPAPERKRTMWDHGKQVQ